MMMRIAVWAIRLRGRPQQVLEGAADRRDRDPRPVAAFFPRRCPGLLPPSCSQTQEPESQPPRGGGGGAPPPGPPPKIPPPPPPLPLAAPLPPPPVASPSPAPPAADSSGPAGSRRRTGSCH